jgi:hypothetical protein
MHLDQEHWEPRELQARLVAQREPQEQLGQVVALQVLLDLVELRELRESELRELLASLVQLAHLEGRLVQLEPLEFKELRVQLEPQAH